MGETTYLPFGPPCYTTLVGMSAVTGHTEVSRMDVTLPIWSFSTPAAAEALREVYTKWLSGEVLGRLILRKQFATLICDGVSVCEFMRAD